MRVLVVGASGAIGRELVAELRRAGHEVIGVARSQAGGELVRQLGGRPVVADVLDRAGLLRALDGLTADAVVDEATAALGEAERQVLPAGGVDRVDGVDGVALRYGFVYGPGPASERLVTMLRRRLFPLPPSGGGHLGWLFVRDAAIATVAAIERGHPGQAYNVVDDQPATWAEVVDALAAAVGARPPRRVPVPLIRLAAPFFADQMIDTSMRVSNAKAKAELGWAPACPATGRGCWPSPRRAPVGPSRSAAQRRGARRPRSRSGRVR